MLLSTTERPLVQNREVASILEAVEFRRGRIVSDQGVLPVPQGNHVVKFGKDLIYRTKVMWKRPSCQKFYL
jgi:hypothetical protein